MTNYNKEKLEQAKHLALRLRDKPLDAAEFDETLQTLCDVLMSIETAPHPVGGFIDDGDL